MRKTIIIGLVILLMVSLFGCAKKSAAVTAVEEAIDSIGEITILSKDKIDEVEKEYGYLTDSEKEQVENRTSLLRAIDEYNELLHDTAVGSWSVEYVNASYLYSFREDGSVSFFGYDSWEEKSLPQEHGTWKIEDNKIQVSFSDGTTDTLKFVIVDDQLSSLHSEGKGHYFERDE